MKNKNIYIRLLLLVFSVFIILSFQGCELFKKKYEKTEKYEYNISTKGRNKLVVDLTNGDIKIKRNSQDSVVRIIADVTKHVSKKELDKPFDDVSADIDTTGSDITFRGIETKHKKVVNFSFGRGNYSSYTIYIPDNFEISIDGTNNDIEAYDVNANLKADVTNGSIKIRNVYGDLKLESTNGNINAELDSAKKCDFQTTNGTIKLKAGEKLTGLFKGETVNGDVKYKNIQFENLKQSKKTFEGNIGNTNNTLTFKTTNGNITIERK